MAHRRVYTKSDLYPLRPQYAFSPLPTRNHKDGVDSPELLDAINLDGRFEVGY